VPFIKALADLTETDIPEMTRAFGTTILHDGGRIRPDTTSGVVEILRRTGTPR
jgi:hypothetical protein